ncbi:Transposase DDE domain group 1 [Nitrosomonas sp. Nm132]|nr:Transposase DDE domain group 1 [Nitrosomonas sp. Nm132]
MPAIARPAANSVPEQLCFNSIPGFTVRADFAGGELSSGFGAVVLDTVDHRIGLIDRLTAAISDSRDARYPELCINFLLPILVSTPLFF